MCGRAARYEIRGNEEDVAAHWGESAVVATYADAPPAGSRVEVTIEDPGLEFYGIQAADEERNLSRVFSVAVESGQPPAPTGANAHDDDSGLWLISTVCPTGMESCGPASRAVNIVLLLMIPAGLVLFLKHVRYL
jgi:hypothetical protein